MDRDDPKPGEDSPGSSKNRDRDRALKPGESFGNFRVVRCMSTGLIANYYHMQHVRDLHDVTVAVFHSRASGNGPFLKRLQALQEKLQSVSHEGIPKIRDCAEIKERYCIFLDPVQGTSLSDHFAEHAKSGEGGFSVEETTRILALLHGILGYAHVQGIDHRDLNTDLIYLTKDGGMRVLGLGVKAALGIELFESIVSASVSPLESQEHPTRLDSFNVMSPEYRSGVKEDGRVDIYAAGYIGYWLVTSIKPNLRELKPPSELVDGLPRSWDGFFRKSLERNRDERYQSSKTALLGLKDTEPNTESESASLIQRQIDRIPVPEGIRERGELATRVYRLTLIGLIGVTLTALAAQFLKVAFTSETDYSRKVAMKTSAERNPDVTFKLSPDVVRVTFVEYEDSFISFGGELNLLVQPGSYKLRVSAPEYFPRYINLEVKKEMPQIMGLDLRPAWADIEVQSEPATSVFLIAESGAEILLGETDEKGTFFLKQVVREGDFSILLRKRGFKEYRIPGSEFVPGELTKIEAGLEAFPSTLTVRTIPEGATIFLDDEELGLSPIIDKSVPPGDEYLVAARLEGYRSVGRRISLDMAEEETIDFGEMVPRSGSLRLALDFVDIEGEAERELIAQTTVKIGEEVYAAEDPGLERILEGRHEVLVEHPLYETDPISIRIRDRAAIDFDVELVPKPAVLTLTVPEGYDAEIRMNGAVVELGEGGRLEVPSNAEALVEVHIPEHLIIKRTVKLGPADSIDWAVKPVPIPGPAFDKEWMIPYVGMKMAWIGPGTFTMGSPPPEPGRLPNEGPQTELTLTRGYWICKTEVTQRYYRFVTGKNPSEFIDASAPVEMVTWEDARRFCELLNESEGAAGRLPEGYAYRLPTEAEWEYAARGGSKDPFSFGTKADVTMGNFRGVYPADWTEGKRSSDTYGTMPVGQFPPNGYGLVDVHGNVREWTLDRFNGRLNGRPTVDPAPRVEGPRIALRGGGWGDNAVRARTAARESIRPDTRSNAIGFRIVLAPEVP